MANAEHRANLRAGVEAWNHWRLDNPGTIPDLTRAHLNEVNLYGANLYGADLRTAHGLTQLQIDSASTCAKALLPPGLHRSDKFDKAEAD